MPNPTWPPIQNPAFPLGESGEDTVIRSPFEAGYEQTRARFTRSRATFSLQWKAMPVYDLVLLKAFYKDGVGNGAGLFDWEYPKTREIKTVRFTKPIESVEVEHNIYQVQVTLREV